MKDFSLLISVYKGEKAEFLTMCFDSIYQQTLLPTEIVLVEDGPLTPSLYAAIKKEEERFPNIKRLVLSENSGLGIALNKGMEACSFDIIARMDTDDICMPERFSTQIDFMESHPEVDVLGAWITEFYNNPSNVITIRNVPEKHNDIFKVFIDILDKCHLFLCQLKEVSRHILRFSTVAGDDDDCCIVVFFNG